MPFTFSHPAIVLPLNRFSKNWISTAGLIIGSMTPDFEYFIRMRVESVYSHTWVGLFWFDLPLGLFLTLVYQVFVKDNLIDNLPIGLNRRFSRFKGICTGAYSLRYLVIIGLSVLVGALSHILWDGFTHPDGCFVKLIPALSAMVQLGSHHLYIYNIIQHASTLIGGIVIVIAIYTLPLGVRTKNQHTTGFWIQIMAVLMIIFIIKLETGLALNEFGNIIVTIIAGGLLGLIIASVVRVRLNPFKKPR